MKLYTVLLLLLHSSIIFGTQQPDFQLDKGAGPFNMLPTDLNCLLAAKLPPKDKNTLRKTCKAFSNFLSFCNASRFVLYNGFYAAKKDISSIFAVATFDKNYKLVEGLCNKYGFNNHNYGCIERKCRFSEINSTAFICLDRKNELIISPYSIACYNNDTFMMELLEKYRLSNSTSIPTSENKTTESDILPKNLNFLIACISRNAQRIVKAVKYIKQFDDTSIGLGLATIIANDDSSSLALIIHHPIIKKCIQNNDTNFLDLAIFGRHSKVSKTLITSKHFDFSNGKKEISWGKCLRIYSGTYLDFLNCCKEPGWINESVFPLLKENGAKTSEDPIIDTEAIVSSIKNAWDDFAWSSLLNKQ